MAEESADLVLHLMEQCPDALDAVTYVNLGGGHYITHPDYERERLIDAINRLQQRHDVQVILEPGGTLVYEAGYLVTRVVDILPKADHTIAIMDCSVTCHMPDVLEVPYRPAIMGDEDAHPHAYLLAGNTCLTGDILGTYRFAEPLQVGQALVLRDMLQYSFVKNTSFNGVRLPDLGILYESGEYRPVHRFGYDDFASRLGFD
jgi:carboxynorspermidine decarboxylase